LRAYEHFAHLRTSATAGGWLKTVTTNLTLNYLSRYRKRWRLFSELGPAADEDSSGPEPGVQPDTLLADFGAEQYSSTARCVSSPSTRGWHWCCITSRSFPTRRLPSSSMSRLPR
jgi:DNA-directed RNA polymerase specialized sigma24 family protein